MVTLARQEVGTAEGDIRIKTREVTSSYGILVFAASEPGGGRGQYFWFGHHIFRWVGDHFEDWSNDTFEIQWIQL